MRTHPRAGIDARPHQLELSFDGSLTASARLILLGLAADVDRSSPVVTATDRELSDRHGVSERTIRGALAAGERAGWVRRYQRRDMAEAVPVIARRAPPMRARRYVVLLWLLAPAEAAKMRRQPVAGPRPACGADLPAQPGIPAPICRPLACARSDFEQKTYEESTYVPPPSPPPIEQPLFTGLPRPVAERLRRQLEAAAEREARADYVPPPEFWEPAAAAPTRTVRVQVDEMVAACVGPDAEAGIAALLLWLARELRDDKPLSRECWSRGVRQALCSAEGFGRLVDLVVEARRKRYPSRWFSACMAAEARGQPGKKLTPGATDQVPPGASQRLPTRRLAPNHNHTRGVNP